MRKNTKSKASLRPARKKLKVTATQSQITRYFTSRANFRKLPSQGGDSKETTQLLSLASGSTPTARENRPCVIEVDDSDDSLGTAVCPTDILSLAASSSVAGSAMPPDPTVHDDLSQDPLTFNPSSQSWTTSSLPYSFLARALVSLSATRSRTMINNVLTNTIRTIIIHDPDSLLSALYLLSNTLAPPYAAVELGLGPSLISRSVRHISGITRPAFKRLYNKHGDIGDVAFVAKSNLRTLCPHPPLLVKDIYSSLLSVAHVQGQGAEKAKRSVLEKLLLSATGEEVRYLARTLTQNLRVGALRASILTALSRAMVLTPVSILSRDREHSTFHASIHQLREIQPTSKGKVKSTDPAREEIYAMFIAAESLVKRVYVQHPNYEHIVKNLLQGGLDDLDEKVSLSIGIPLIPTLGSPARSLDEVYSILDYRPFIAEFKYDGQRAQVHASKQAGNVFVKIFSRHLEDMTCKYPDVVSLVNLIFELFPQISSFIFDAEIVAVDREGHLRSFQDLSNRPRKVTRLEDILVSVCVFIFDLMYLNGEVLLSCPFRHRRARLRSHFHPFSPRNRLIARFDHVAQCESGEGRVIVENFWSRALDSCCEGIMVKLLDNESTADEGPKPRRNTLQATYEPDKRTFAWLKLKKDYVAGLGDTLDLIPVGAWYGNGRKVRWWSPILLGVWQPETGRVIVCKCMSGFTDEFYKNLSVRYPLYEDSETCSPQPLWECDFGGLKPEVYFKPSEVWEIRGADITISPVSVAAIGLVSSIRGLSVRFPRFLKIRDDKQIEQASTPQFLAQLWRSQKNHVGADDGELIDLDVEVESELELGDECSD